MRLGRLLRAVPVAAAIAAIPAAASAHPLGNFSINHYAAVTVSVDAIAVDLVIDLAEIPTIEALAAIDRDADGSAAAGELAAAADPACRGRSAVLSVSVAGHSVPLDATSAVMELAPGAGGLHTMRTTCALFGRLSAPIESSAIVTIADAGDPDRIGWREIVVRGDGVIVDPDESVDVSGRLGSYPDDLLERPLDERSVTVKVSPGGSDVAIPGPSTAGSTRDGDGTPTIEFGELTPVAMLIGVLVAAVTGAAHALTPGHGKTLMAAYLVGTRGRPRDAVLLGLAVTASHTVGVVALAGVVLVAGSALPVDRLYPMLSGISGLLVLGIGAWLLIGCLRDRRSHPHGHPHEHPHPHRSADAEGPVGRASLLAIGLAGGMIPSPAALVLLLGAIAAGQTAYGLLVAVAFGVGMAVVLVALGLLVVRGRSRLMAVAARLPGIIRLAPAVPWVAGAVVLVSGLALTGGALAAAI